jgi:hypothetical protein
MTRREKFTLAGLAGFVAVAAVGVFVVVPAVQRLYELDRLIMQKEKELVRIVALQEHYMRLSNTREEVLKKIRSRGKDFAIFSYLESLAADSGLKSQIQYMRPLSLPQQDAVEGFIAHGLEIRLTNVGIDQLVGYLYRIEYSDKILKVESLRLKPVYTDPQFINATFRVVTYDLV